MLALFVTNCSEALLAAVGVRWFSDAPARFDTLRRVTVFIVAAVPRGAVPVLVPRRGGRDGDARRVVLAVWRTRFFSNVLTELTLVPAIVTLVTAGPAWLRTASRARRVEAAALAAALLAVGIVVFAGPIEGLDVIPGAPVTPLAFLLPFILWAAVRFGPGGASLALLATALVAIWAATHAARARSRACRSPRASSPSRSSW